MIIVIFMIKEPAMMIIMSEKVWYGNVFVLMLYWNSLDLYDNENTMNTKKLQFS